jgi:hypothetical protein
MNFKIGLSAFVACLVVMFAFWFSSATAQAAALPVVDPCVVDCYRVELINAIANNNGTTTLTWRITNNCNRGLSHVSFSLPTGVVATEPTHKSIYTAPSGLKYEVENPTNNPFYAIKFNTTGSEGIKNGGSDLFTYTIPGSFDPDAAMKVEMKASTNQRTLDFSPSACKPKPTPTPEETSTPVETPQETPPPTATPTPVPALNLTFMCAYAGDDFFLWRVTNSNGAAVDYTWDVYKGAESGGGTVPANDVVYFTTSTGSKTVRLFVAGKLVNTKASGQPCKVDLTLSYTCDDNGQQLWSVYNGNDFDQPFTWSSSNGLENGAGIAPAKAATTFGTANGNHTVTASYIHAPHAMRTVSASAEACTRQDEPPVETPTETPEAPVETPTETPTERSEPPTETPIQTPETPVETPEPPVETPAETPEPPVEPPAETPEPPVETPAETPEPPVETPTETPELPVETPTETPQSTEIPQEVTTPVETPAPPTSTPEPPSEPPFTGSELAAIGDYVWEDANGNGLQETDEPPVAGVVVRLFTQDHVLVGATQTGSDGRYGFSGLQPGGYYLVFDPTTLPPGYRFTLANQGDRALDSDADPVTGATAVVVLVAGQTDLTWDAGVVKIIGGSDPTNLEEGAEPTGLTPRLWLPLVGNS